MNPRPGPPDGTPPRALCFGEALIDVYPERRVVAGAPLHVAVHLAARGWRAQLVTRLGLDADGDRIEHELRRRGVDTALLERDPHLPTGTVTIHVDPATVATGGHRFEIHAPAAWDAITGPPEPEGELLHYGTLAGRDGRSRAALLRLVERSRAPLRLFDPNLRPPHVDRALVEAGLARATVLKVNDEELQALAQLLGTAPAAAAFFARAPELAAVCVTHGQAGASLYHPDGNAWHIAGSTLPVVDTVGAGDAFAAGLADALHRRLDPPAALAQARAAADAVLVRPGGLPPLPPAPAAG